MATTTLAIMLARWREKLDDVTGPAGSYGWEDSELTEYANRIIEELCRECWLILDTTTASIVTVPITASTPTLALSERIIHVKRAKLSSQMYPLFIHSVNHMDSNYLNWEDADAGTPSILIDEGLGDGVGHIYPPSDTSDTLNLHVYRLPITELNASTTTGTPEIAEKWVRFIDNGVYREAYAKHDEDTESMNLHTKFASKFENDKDNIKREILQTFSKDETVAPHLAFS
jgi:hypothetical protein